MSTVRKFTFDLDFDAPEEPETPEPEVEEEEEEEIVPTFSEEEVEEARQKGFDAGKEEGRREAADATEQKLLETIEQACTQLADVYNTQTEANREIGREMISVATAIAKKMFPDLNARNALGEVERVVQETLKAVTEEPRIQIMVNPELREPLSERLSTMTHRAGFEGKVFVNPDPAMQLGDCRIEWSNGAAVRDSEEMWQMIDKIIEENLHDIPDDDDDDDAPAESRAEPAPAPTDEKADTEAEPEDRKPETDKTEPAATPEPEPASEPEPEPASDPEPETVTEREAAPGEAADSAPEMREPDGSEPEAEPEAEPATDAPEIPETDDAPEPAATPESEARPEVGDDVDRAGIEETPSWEAAVGESAGVNTAPEPAPMPEPEPEPAIEDSDDAPEAADVGSHGPSFAPNVDDGDEPAETDKTEPGQGFMDEDREAPIPHLDDETGEGAGGGDDVGSQAGRVSDPDPVSPSTQAAILDAQSAMDDDDENPSGG